MAEEVEWAKVCFSSRPTVVPSAMGPEEHRQRITGQESKMKLKHLVSVSGT